MTIELIEAFGTWVILPLCITAVAIVALGLHAVGQLDKPKREESDDDNGG